MTVKLRNCKGREDFFAVSDFLMDTYEPGGKYPNWLQPRWDYMHSHPSLDASSLDKIAIWEDGVQIVAVVNCESTLGEAFFNVRKGYEYLKKEMLDYAEQNLLGVSENGNKELAVYVNDFGNDLLELVRKRGYVRYENTRPPHFGVSQFIIPKPFPEIILPEGYKLKSLADDNDLHKIHRVMWRGFNHEGEPPEEGIAWRIQMQSSPNFRKDLTIVVEAPNGDFAAICGMWYEPKNKIAYVEPVATDPTYRHMGLGKAAVYEGIRRCSECGATVAFVESDQQFYLDIGFERIFIRHPWIKEFK
jgi:GNAT superfamily N-acetyltransferase